LKGQNKIWKNARKERTLPVKDAERRLTMNGRGKDLRGTKGFSEKSEKDVSVLEKKTFTV
jgi:hypothetical protein